MSRSGVKNIVDLARIHMVLIPLLVDDPLWEAIEKWENFSEQGLNPSFSG